jgi:mono/diheme cytochrome c family protein
MKPWLPAMFVCVLALAVPRLVAAQPAPNESPRGKPIYETYCAFCHGTDGRADTPVGRVLKPAPRNFTDPVQMGRLGEDQIYRAIKEGKPGTAMAAWRQVLSEPQIGDVIDYIHSFMPAGAQSLSAERLSLEIGRRIYDKECAFCHGLHGDADTDAARVLQPRPRNFADPTEMARVDDGRMYAAIKIGRPATAMAGWGDLLSPAEIIDVMRYIRSLERPLPAGLTRTGLDVLVGGRIYTQYCVACHGEKGDAQTELGRALVPHPRDFTRGEQMSRTSDDEMARVISRGSAGTAMAPWGGILDPDDIRRVILFIRQTFARTR